MAADEDQDAFEHEHKGKRLPELGDQVHVYFNRGDTSLVISDKTKQNPTRLGTRGPQVPRAVLRGVPSDQVAKRRYVTAQNRYVLEE